MTTNQAVDESATNQADLSDVARDIALAVTGCEWEGELRPGVRHCYVHGLFISNQCPDFEQAVEKIEPALESSGLTELLALVAMQRAQLDAARTVLAEYVECATMPAPLTQERALFERICVAVGFEESDAHD